MRQSLLHLLVQHLDGLSYFFIASQLIIICIVALYIILQPSLHWLLMWTGDASHTSTASVIVQPRDCPTITKRCCCSTYCCKGCSSTRSAPYVWCFNHSVRDIVTILQDYFSYCAMCAECTTLHTASKATTCRLLNNSRLFTNLVNCHLCYNVLRFARAHHVHHRSTVWQTLLRLHHTFKRLQWCINDCASTWHKVLTRSSYFASSSSGWELALQLLVADTDDAYVQIPTTILYSSTTSSRSHSRKRALKLSVILASHAKVELLKP